MRKLFLIIITLIILSCSKEDISSCEENNTYNLEVVNNSDSIICLIIWTWYDNVPHNLYDSTSASLNVDFIKTFWMGKGQISLLEDLKAGYTVFGYGDGRYISNTNECNSVKWYYYDEFLTESCESYALEINDISIDE